MGRLEETRQTLAEAKDRLQAARQAHEARREVMRREYPDLPDAEIDLRMESTREGDQLGVALKYHYHADCSAGYEEALAREDALLLEDTGGVSPEQFDPARRRDCYECNGAGCAVCAA